MRRASRRGWAILAVLATAGWMGSGCALTGVPSEELPEDLIAFVYYDAEVTRRREDEALRRLEEIQGGPRLDPRRAGQLVAEMSEISHYLKHTLGVGDSERKPLLSGRLALLDPRSGELEIVEAARRGAMPQDWSPDHRRLLFSQVVHDEIPQLFEYDVATGDVWRRTRGHRAHPEGCYGPEGRVVFTAVDQRSRHGNAHIMITDPDGGEPQLLSGGGYAYYPTCSPDGSAVAYTALSDDRRSARIVVRTPVLDGHNRPISSGKEPSFSTDGAWIVYSARSKGEWTIWRIRPDGSGRTAVGRSGTDEQRPSLSPDRRLIVYVADTKINQRLYLRRFDGTGTRILVDRGDGDRPVW